MEGSMTIDKRTSIDYSYWYINVMTLRSEIMGMGLELATHLSVSPSPFNISLLIKGHFTTQPPGRLRAVVFWWPAGDRRLSCEAAPKDDVQKMTQMKEGQFYFVPRFLELGYRPPVLPLRLHRFEIRDSLKMMITSFRRQGLLPLCSHSCDLPEKSSSLTFYLTP